jgi:hypothetical protein
MVLILDSRAELDAGLEPLQFFDRHAHVGENPAKCPFADVVAGMYWHGVPRPSGWRMM